MTTTYRFGLDEHTFRMLINGRIVRFQARDMSVVELTLDDVPWNRIVGAIADTLAERLPQLALRPPDPPQAREFVTTRNRRK